MFTNQSLSIIDMRTSRVHLGDKSNWFAHNFTSDLLTMNHEIMTDKTKLLLTPRPYAVTSYLPISSKPSLVKLPSTYASNSSAIEPSECLDESITEILFSALSSFVGYPEEDLVDMEDEEILELWQNENGQKASSSMMDANKMNVIVEKSNLTEGDATRGAITQALMPNPRVFIAKSA